MKKIRLILGMLAFVFAIGGAIASSAFKSQTVLWENIGGNCFDVSHECDGGEHACRVSPGRPQLHATNTPASTCGPELYQSVQ
ncbi:MAG: DUF6520 family protein [Bacteroidota bacterium]